MQLQVISNQKQVAATYEREVKGKGTRKNKNKKHLVRKISNKRMRDKRSPIKR